MYFHFSFTNICILYHCRPASKWIGPILQVPGLAQGIRMHRAYERTQNRNNADSNLLLPLKEVMFTGLSVCQLTQRFTNRFLQRNFWKSMEWPTNEVIVCWWQKIMIRIQEFLCNKQHCINNSCNIRNEAGPLLQRHEICDGF